MMSQQGNVTQLAAPVAPQSLAKFEVENFWPKNWDEALRYASILARAPSMLPKHIRESKDPAAEAFAHIMFGFEVGLAPINALRAIYIVHGRAGMYAADQIALVQKHPDCEKLEVATTKDGKPLSDEKSCTWVTKRRGRNEQRLTFTYAEAESEGLVAQNPKYKTSPAVMLRWRCATRLLAFTWGDVLRGLEDREHVEVEEKAGGWAQRVTPPPPPVSSAPPPSDFPPHDPTTGEVKETPEDAQVVDELAVDYLLSKLAAAATKDDLQVCVLLVEKSKAAGKLTPDEVKKLGEAYKAKSAEVKANGNGGGK